MTRTALMAIGLTEGLGSLTFTRNSFDCGFTATCRIWTCTVEGIMQDVKRNQNISAKYWPKGNLSITEMKLK